MISTKATRPGPHGAQVQLQSHRLGVGGRRGQGHLPLKVQLHSWFCLSPEQRGWTTKASPAAADGWALKTRSLLPLPYTRHFKPPISFYLGPLAP